MPNCCTLHILPFQLSLSRFIFISLPMTRINHRSSLPLTEPWKKKKPSESLSFFLLYYSGEPHRKSKFEPIWDKTPFGKRSNFFKNKFSWVGAPFTKTTMTLVIIHIIIWKIGSNISCVTKDCSRPWLVLIILVSAFLFKHCHFICRVAGVGDCVKIFCCHYVSCLVVGFHWKLFQSTMAFVESSLKALQKHEKLNFANNYCMLGGPSFQRRSRGPPTSATLFHCTSLRILMHIFWQQILLIWRLLLLHHSSNIQNLHQALAIATSSLWFIFHILMAAHEEDG